MAVTITPDNVSVTEGVGVGVGVCELGIPGVVVLVGVGVFVGDGVAVPTGVLAGVDVFVRVTVGVSVGVVVLAHARLSIPVANTPAIRIFFTWFTLPTFPVFSTPFSNSLPKPNLKSHFVTSRLQAPHLQ